VTAKEGVEKRKTPASVGNERAGVFLFTITSLADKTYISVLISNNVVTSRLTRA
jgi:hypothetical protein